MLVILMIMKEAYRMLGLAQGKHTAKLPFHNS